MKVQVVKALMPHKGTIVRDQVCELLFDSTTKRASMKLSFSGWFSDKRDAFTFPDSVVKAYIMKPESVRKMARVGAFSRGAGAIPGGGLIGLTARVISGGLSTATNSSDGASGLIVGYKNEKDVVGSFCLIGETTLIESVSALLSPEQLGKEGDPD